MHQSAGTHRGRKRVLNLLVLELPGSSELPQMGAGTEYPETLLNLSNCSSSVCILRDFSLSIIRVKKE